MRTPDELEALVAEKERLLHDLHAHQLELEAQNRELREARGRLEESQSHYADLYDFAPMSYFTLDTRGVIVEVNLTGATMVGRERAHLLGLPFAAAVRIDDPARFWDHLRRCVEAPGAVVTELGFAGASGHMDVQMRSSPVRERTGRAVAFRTAFTDISQRKTAESEQARLHEVERRVRARFQALDEAAMAIGKALAHLSSNTLSTLLQVVVDEARMLADAEYAAVGLGTDPSSRFVPWVFSGMSTNVARTIGRTPRVTGVLGLVAREGRTLRLKDLRESPLFGGFPAHHPPMSSFLGVPIRFGGHSIGSLYLANKHSADEFSDDDEQLLEMLGDRVGFAVEIANLSLERDLRESKLQESIRARENLLAVVSHDLRTPLNAIYLSAGMLSAQPRREGDPNRKQLDIIRSAAGRMTRLINDLLQAAAIESGTFTIEPSPQDPRAMIDAFVDASAGLAAASEVRIERCEEPSLPEIVCDHDRIIQVLSNLVGNAIKFSPRGGVVRITVERTGPDLRFCVSDSGPGIPPELLPHVFDRYWKGQATGRHGTGLGLYIARGIVEAHGGTMTVESTVGGGSTFCFTIPLKARAAEELTP